MATRLTTHTAETKKNKIILTQSKEIIMKKLLLLLTITLTLSCCNKNDDDQPANPIDQLPPATQTGANTFGCLLDGEIFIPDNLPNSTNCFYQLVDGAYYFTVRASNSDQNFNSYSLAVKTEQKQIFEDESYELLEALPANAYGMYSLVNMLNYTNSNNSGELTITKLDIENQIVSGTFWYDIEDQNGVIHQIREGRFDMQFTQ